MSRVHDALKKAEQEKVMPGEGPSRVESVAPSSPGNENIETTGVAADQPPPASAPSVAAQDELISAAFLARCSRQNWVNASVLTQHADGRRHALVSEQFRTLRSQLYLMRKGRRVQTLMVTSPLPHEGKTFVAVNLARVIAKQTDRRVLLIDGDLRISALHNVLGAPSGPGLAEYLAGEFDVTSVIQRGPAENLFFIPGGANAANPTELLGNGRLELLISRVAPVFDWIIIDSPPVLPVSDTRLIAGFCDGVLMLVNSGTTPFDLAQKACGKFLKSQLLGVILNRVEPEQTYGSYYYYGKGNHREGDGRGAQV